MLELFLVRHAKSSWKDLSLDDFERPLNSRGKRSASFMAQKLLELNHIPELIISSPAKRAKQTAKALCKKLCTQIVYNPTLYDATKYDIYSVINAVSNEYQTLFIVGHNPTLDEFASDIVNLNEHIPTCGIVHIKFDCKSWDEVDSSCAKLLQFIFPKKYNDFFDYF